MSEQEGQANKIASTRMMRGIFLEHCCEFLVTKMFVYQSERQEIDSVLQEYDIQWIEGADGVQIKVDLEGFLCN